MNLVVLIGTLSRAPEERLLPSGDRLVQYEVTTRRAAEPAASVPVVWFAAPPQASGGQAGDQVAVLGRVRRRFFRAGGFTQSRTEVVAERVVPTRRGAQVARLRARAVAVLNDES
jgi:single-strand DNA-binding protein